MPPTVDAGPDVSGEVNDDIELNGSVTDPDNTPTILWTIDSPDCTFSDDTDPETVVNCTSTGTFPATLTANDGINLAVVDTTLVTVNPPPPGLNVSAGPERFGRDEHADLLERQGHRPRIHPDDGVDLRQSQLFVQPAERRGHAHHVHDRRCCCGDAYCRRMDSTLLTATLHSSR